MSSQSLYILWDESQIWGLLAWRGVLGLGLPYKLVRAQEIRHGLLSGKPPAILLVPGGSARLKSKALGAQGMQNIRDYVASGGHYLGFCGGAGLGLSPKPNSDDESLGLCPWSRGIFTDRLQHFMSGHLQASFPNPKHPLSPPQGETKSKHLSAANANPAAKPDAETLAGDVTKDFHKNYTPEKEPHLSALTAGATGAHHHAEHHAAKALLPVWWPGRFSPAPVPEAFPLAGSPTVLATYGPPGEDFWLADLPTRLLPPDAYSDWENLYGISISPDFLTGQPCVVHGCYGAGSYTLSYSHLETPHSPFANAWLAKLAKKLGGFTPSANEVPAWHLDEQNVVWGDSGLLACRHMMRGLIDTGLEHNLLFRRNDWLYGWRSGMPGLQLTSLYAAFASIISLPPGRGAEAMWARYKEEFLQKMEIFAIGTSNYLLAERLAMTLAKSAPGTLSNNMLQRQRVALFGQRNGPGGLYKEMMDIVDELAWLQIEE